MSPLLRKRIGLIAAILLISGLVRLPWQSSLLDRLQDSGFHREPEGASVISQLGVEAAVGALGGLRYLVATYFELSSVDPWEEEEWEVLHENYRIICLLQPGDINSWRSGAWHCGYNARAYYEHDADNLSAAARKEKVDLYTKRGIRFLDECKKWNPDSFWAYRDLGLIYQEKVKDPCAAADEFLAGSKTSTAPSFLFRFYCYQAALCPGREQEAYDAIKPLYDFGYEQLTIAKSQGYPQSDINNFIKGYWKPTLILTIKDLEEKLGIPAEQRILETWDSRRLSINSPFRVEINSKDADN
ncbi:MAG: hypothetical protein ACI8UO_004284 [Verrucomicrobiales bacterium]|jgi:hypothetical protein